MPLDHGSTAEPVARLIEELSKLPGVGAKTAQRLTYFIVRQREEDARALADAIIEVKERIRPCGECYNLSDRDPCHICDNTERDRTRICVVEEPLDVLAIERTGRYKGLYHVLHGTLTPSLNIGPEELRIPQLVERVRKGNVQEVILALNPTVEGDATAAYIIHALAPLKVKVTRLARGLPTGGDLEYADEETLKAALDWRRTVG
jgi:recombination protein RecR